MFENFQNFVPKISHQLKVNQELVAATICHLARETIKQELPEIANQIEIVSFIKGTLKIKATSNIVLQELHYSWTKLQEQINTKINSNPLLSGQKIEKLLNTT